MNLVMDANALIAYLDNEEGADVVEALLTDPANTCYAHAVNICEVYYDFVRRADATTAWAFIERLAEAGVTIREDMDAEFWRRAGQHKAEIVRVSLADCFCLTLAHRLNAQLATADHHEFDKVAESGICDIRFIRPAAAEPNADGD